MKTFNKEFELFRNTNWNKCVGKMSPIDYKTDPKNFFFSMEKQASPKYKTVNSLSEYTEFDFENGRLLIFTLIEVKKFQLN